MALFYSVEINDENVTKMKWRMVGAAAYLWLAWLSHGVAADPALEGDSVNASALLLNAHADDVKAPVAVLTAVPVPEENSEVVPQAGATASKSIDHVEAHLSILQALELTVARSIEEMNAKMLTAASVGRRKSRQYAEMLKLSQELGNVQVCLTYISD